MPINTIQPLAEGSKNLCNHKTDSGNTCARKPTHKYSYNNGLTVDYICRKCLPTLYSWEGYPGLAAVAVEELTSA